MKPSLFKTLLFLLLTLNVRLFADFFHTEEQTAKKYQAERARLCKLFTQKAIDYKKTMRDDKLAYVTLESYKNRASIYCSKEPEKKITSKKEALKEVIKVEKNIFLEDERLCKIFKDKIFKYQENMRIDSLAYITLESYKKRAYIFCSEESLEEKEKKVREEDKQLCHLFTQGPKVCILFEKEVQSESDDAITKVTLDSFKKQASIFCSDAELEEKDKKVHATHEALCHLYSHKMELYRNALTKDENYAEHLKLYTKRFNYFCGNKRVKD